MPIGSCKPPLVAARSVHRTWAWRVHVRKATICWPDRRDRYGLSLVQGGDDSFRDGGGAVVAGQCPARALDRYESAAGLGVQLDGAGHGLVTDAADAFHSSAALQH